MVSYRETTKKITPKIHYKTHLRNENVTSENIYFMQIEVKEEQRNKKSTEDI